MHVQELARKVGAEAPDDADFEVTGLATIEAAGPGEVTFLANDRYVARLRTCGAAAVFVAPSFTEDVPPVRLVAKDPYLAFARALRLFHEPVGLARGVHPTAVLGEGVSLGRDVAVGAFVVVGDGVRIGEGATLHPHVVVYAGAEIGPGCILHSHAVVREHVRLGAGVILQNGVVVGADGFGFVRDEQGRWEKIPQAGDVVLGDDVEVQANSAIDRATVGTTRIGRGTKLDNLVQVGHGCQVGEDTLLCGQVGLAGSTEIGDRAVLAGQVGIAGHCRIGDDVVIAAQSGASTNIDTPGMYGGSPVMEMRRYRRMLAVKPRLPEMHQALRDLERRVRAIEEAGREG